MARTTADPRIDAVGAASRAEELIEALLDRSGVAEQPIDIVTPALFAGSMAKAARAAARRPGAVAGAAARLTAGSLSATAAAAGRIVGMDLPTPLAPAKQDRRFDDPAWQDNAAYLLLQQLYLLQTRFVDDIVDAADLDALEDRKARFAARFLTDALAPTNTLPGNPAALRRAYETRGKSLLQGWRNFMHDVRTNGGWPSQVDTRGYAVGENMAVTPGSVVYRSDLIEVIHYRPQTPKVFSIPLLFCPPWINKYYIMDLAPGRSLIEWALRQGHQCFAISYRNPTAEMKDHSFEDYLLGGPFEAIDVVKEITGSPVVNTLSVCLGGTLTAMAMCLEADQPNPSINTATLINAHTDFTQAGGLGVFTDEGTVRGIERRMDKRGFLDNREMARTFDLLRANDLVFQYVVSNWLMGESPPAFDLLAWNDDSTRMPATMYSEYLRSCFIENAFARGELTLAGKRLEPGAVRTETYIVGAVNDHIVPWTSAYRTTQVLGGHNRFTLAGSGHIAGIVSPPGPKAKHWTNPATPVDPEAWQEGAMLQERTWWEDWSRWAVRRSGRKVPAPRVLGSERFPPLEDAPGRYVRERAS